MPTAFKLKLDVSDATTRDTLRGPGSSTTEQIPSTSPILSSPFASSVDAYGHLEQGDSAVAFDEVLEKEGRKHEEDEPEFHVVVVGGDVGAFTTALALARCERARVTLVNAGLGSLNSRGVGLDSRACLLNACSLTYLDELGRWEGSNYRDSSTYVPSHSDSRITRWKGKGPASEFIGISERIQEEGIRLRALQIQRYSTGQTLATQAYSILTGEDVSMFGVDYNLLLTVLRDACISHPRIDFRPRGVAQSVVSGTAVSPHWANPGEEGASSKSTKNSDFKSGRSDTGETVMPPSRDREQRRRARDSFIQLDDDDYDFSLPLSSASIPYSGEDASLDDVLRELRTGSPERALFSAEDLPMDLPPAKSDNELKEDLGKCRPAVILTSGERIEADAVLGTEGPESKVLDVVSSGSNHGYGGGIVREDGAFRATISISRLLDNQDLRGLTNKLMIWMGPGRFLKTYPIAYDTLHVLLIMNGEWRQDSPVAEEGDAIAYQMKNEVRGWCPTVRKLMALVDSATYEPMPDYNPLEKWVSDSGRIAVLGDAAHPLLPITHQDLKHTIFDSLTLGALFRKPLLGPPNIHPHLSLRSPYFIPRLLHAFYTLRRPQCIRAQVTLREGRDLFLLEDGDDQRRRDETLRGSGLLSEEEKRYEWLYDPYTQVDRWWESEMTRLAL